MNGWLLAWALGWVAIGWAAGRARRPKRHDTYPMLRELMPESRSIRCAPTKALPRAWTVKR